MFNIVWFIITMILLYLYHKNFKVFYFNLGKGLLSELINAGFVAFAIALFIFYVLLNYWKIVVLISMIIIRVKSHKKNA